MVDESGDTIPPGAFLYIAERYDLIHELDEWVAKQAIELVAREQAAGRDRLGRDQRLRQVTGQRDACST